MIALVRALSPRLATGELTHLPRQPIDLAKAQDEHAQYVATLRELGTRVVALPPLPEAPDGVFVKDTAVVLDELAIVTRPGAASRRGETASVRHALEAYRPTVELAGAECLDGGDVLAIGRTLFVGLSGRTNAAGCARLQQETAPLGYAVRPVRTSGCLHLKTAITFVPPHLVVANPAWVDLEPFRDREVVRVAAEEPFAANTLTIGGVTLVTTGAARTEQLLRAAGVPTRSLDLGELQKAEAGLTCLSLVWRNGSGAPA